MSSSKQIVGESRSALIQVIRLTWAKSARGGVPATKRNTVPSAFSISAGHLRNLDGVTYVETQFWDSSNSFSQPLRIGHVNYPLTETIDLGAVSVCHLAEELEVTYSWDAWEVGAPRRPLSRKLLVASNTWTQLRWNGRFSCADDGQWVYRQSTLNVALFNGPLDGDIFVTSTPSTYFEQMAILW